MAIIKKLKEAGFSMQAELLEKFAVSSIRIETQPAEESDFRLGESKIGGTPHLPDNTEWPIYKDISLGFIAQLNLADIAPFDTEKKLPHEGILYFFHEGGEEVWGFDPKDREGFRVIYHKGDTDNLKITALPENIHEFAILSPCKLSFETSISYPMGENLDAVGLSEGTLKEFITMKRDEMDKYDEIIEEYYDDDHGGHRLLGYPNLVQGDIFSECQLVSNGLYCGDSSGYSSPKAKELKSGISDWTLLFQIDSDDNAEVMWGDCGMIYFAIKKDDLKSGNFDNIWAVFQCC